MSFSHAYDPSGTIPQSEFDGWKLGYIASPWLGPWPKRNGDLFISDPEGWQAGIAWESSGPKIKQISGVSENCWGVFQVLFPIPVMCEHDLIRNFHAALPYLKQQRSTVQSRISE
jgi:hypothetical protein